MSHAEGQVERGTAADWGGGMASTTVVYLFLLDRELRVVDRCCAEPDLLPSADEQALGQVVTDLLPEAHSEAFLRAIGALDAEGRESHTQVGVEVHGSSSRFWEMTVFSLPERGYVLEARDISEAIEARWREQAHVRKLRELAEEIERAADEGRQGIASDLHDRVSQPLAAARLRLEQHVLSCGALELEKAARETGVILELIEAALVECRALTSELAPVVFYELGVGPAVRALCEELFERYGLNCECEVEAGDIPIPDGAAAFVYRAARELLMNVIRHAGVLDASVRLMASAETIRLTVVDPGVGFDLGRLRALEKGSEGGFGLFSIQERASRLGGDLTVDSEIGRGTVVVLELPLKTSRN